MILTSTLACPTCGHRTEEMMPTDACQVFYACTACGARLRPKPGDCCVFCSYGTVPCPPMQTEQAAGEINDATSLYPQLQRFEAERIMDDTELSPIRTARSIVTRGTRSINDQQPYADEPQMLPLRVRVSPDSAETVVLRLGDPGYLAEYRMAAYDYRRFGWPMPYADAPGVIVPATQQTEGTEAE